MTSVATSYGADQLGNAAELTNGYQAAFIGAAGVALAAAVAAAGLLGTRRHQVVSASDRTDQGPPTEEPIAA